MKKNLYFLIGAVLIILGITWLLYNIGFYTEWNYQLIGSDYFYFDLANGCYSLNGGL